MSNYIAPRSRVLYYSHPNKETMTNVAILYQLFNYVFQEHRAISWVSIKPDSLEHATESLDTHIMYGTGIQITIPIRAHLITLWFP